MVLHQTDDYLMVRVVCRVNDDDATTTIQYNVHGAMIYESRFRRTWSRG